MTYELAVASGWSKKRIALINMLKAWKFPDETVLHVVVAEERDASNADRIEMENPAVGRPED